MRLISKASVKACRCDIVTKPNKLGCTPFGTLPPGIRQSDKPTGTNKT